MDEASEIRLPAGVIDIDNYSFIEENYDKASTNQDVKSSNVFQSNDSSSGTPNLKIFNFGNSKVRDVYNMFYNLPNLEEVYLNENIRKIHAMAFSYCPNLKKLYIPYSVLDMSPTYLNNTLSQGFGSNLINIIDGCPLLSEIHTNIGNGNIITQKLETVNLSTVNIIESLPTTPETFPGCRYTGPYNESGPLTVYGQNNVVIEGLIFNVDYSDSQWDFTRLGTIDEWMGYCIIGIFQSTNITIKNCVFNFGTRHRAAINVEGCSNVTIQDCQFNYMKHGVTIGSSNNNLKILYNNFYNILARLIDDDEWGFGAVNFYGNPIQVMFNNGSGNQVSYNMIINTAGEASNEDLISMYQTNGVPESPTIVSHNWARASGYSTSGGGFVLGDYGGSHQRIENNILVNPGFYGISVVGGQHNKLINNKVYGRHNYYSGTGMTIVNYHPNVSNTEGLEVYGNDIYFINGKNYPDVWREDYWNHNTGDVNSSGITNAYINANNNVGENSTVTEDMLLEHFFRVNTIPYDFGY